ncbi:glycerol-3-phosphate dehydrogenase/oxidase [Thiohalorhabdus sp. Cl-TMA]|uniref:Glycerol-3-phosphate dehydrogenase/oxidase n=1 Tax=Thiohalorhabdus methylotrophus TaxID=3242694 RepID=A0ABV4TRQ3_9GAMM
MKVGVVGGGINGLATAWALLGAGHEVELFERDRLMGATSSASSKLLHGGLRYLEHGELRLVRESLRERAWWLRTVPELARPLLLAVPLYRSASRPRWKLKAGLWLYDRLAGKAGIGAHRWRSTAALTALMPGLAEDGLRGGYTFYDGQMDDYRLGLWVADRVRELGGRLHEHAPVRRVSERGTLVLSDTERAYDRVVNVAGPWAERLGTNSGIEDGIHLDPVRGSHILLDRPQEAGLLLEAPQDGRPFFVLPYQGRTLVGTTEVRQSPDTPVVCSPEERDYLLAAYSHYFRDDAGREDVAETFAGIRPLIGSGPDMNRVSREYRITRRGRLITVYGGKWTTARRLGREAARIAAR